MPGRQQASHAVYRRAEVIATLLLHHSGMQSHPHRDATNLLLPMFVMQSLLGREGSVEGLGWGSKSGAEGIAHRLEDVPTMCLNSLAKDGVVEGESGAHLLGV